MTNEEIYTRGKIITDWACDVDIETNEVRSNASVETLIVYERKAYTVISNTDYTVIMDAKEEAIPLTKEMADGFIMQELEGEEIDWED